MEIPALFLSLSLFFSLFFFFLTIIMRITAGLVFIATAVASVMALKEPPTTLQVGKVNFHD